VRSERARFAREPELLQRFAHRVRHSRETAGRVVEAQPHDARALRGRECAERTEPHREVDVPFDGSCNRPGDVGNPIVLNPTEERERQVKVLFRYPSRAGDAASEHFDRARELFLHRRRQREGDEQPRYVASNR